MIFETNRRSHAPEAEHAVAVAEFGPRAPYRMENLSGSQIDNRRGNKKNGEMRSGPPLRSFLVFALDNVESADAARNVNPGRFTFFRGNLQVGHAHGEVGGRQGQLNKPAHFSSVLFSPPT